MKKNEVYIVTSGEYEEYHIDEIFSKKEDAEKYCHERNTNEYEKYEVEEMTLDNYDFKPLFYFLDIQHSYRKDIPVVVNLRHEDYERDTDIEVSKYSDKIRVFINMGIGLPEDINYEYYIEVFKELQELRDCGKDKEYLLDNLNKKLLNNMNNER